MRPVRSILATLAAAIVLAPGAAFADEAVLVLVDGQEIRGIDVERTPEGYVLTLATGEKLSLPPAIVNEVRLSAVGASKDAAPREAPSGIVVTEGRELTGAPKDGRTPRVDEQLAALPESGRSRFRRGPIDPVWRPASDWGRETDVTSFDPARWYRAPIDPTWTPRSAYDASIDVFGGRRASWQRSLIDVAWWPNDGFRRDTEPEQAPADLGPDEDGDRPEVRFEP